MFFKKPFCLSKPFFHFFLHVLLPLLFFNLFCSSLSLIRKGRLRILSCSFWRKVWKKTKRRIWKSTNSWKKRLNTSNSFCWTNILKCRFSDIHNTVPFCLFGQNIPHSKACRLREWFFKQALSNVCNCRHDGQLRFFQYSISKVSNAIMHFPCFFTTFRWSG